MVGEEAPREAPGIMAAREPGTANGGRWFRGTEELLNWRVEGAEMEEGGGKKRVLRGQAVDATWAPSTRRSVRGWKSMQEAGEMLAEAVTRRDSSVVGRGGNPAARTKGDRYAID
jgi:hypothetical protein